MTTLESNVRLALGFDTPNSYSENNWVDLKNLLDGFSPNDLTGTIDPQDALPFLQGLGDTVAYYGVWSPWVEKVDGAGLDLSKQGVTLLINGSGNHSTLPWETLTFHHASDNLVVFSHRMGSRLIMSYLAV